MRRLLLVILVLCALFSPSLLASPWTREGWQRIMESVRPLTAINPETNEMKTICTSTSIGKGYWLTAAHCATPDIPAIFVDGKELAMVVAIDEKTDLAVLHTEKNRAKPLRIAQHEPNVGDTINLIGYPEGLTIQFFHGSISALDTVLDNSEHHMMFDMTACQGNSGSAIVDIHDHIVSVLQVGYGDGCSAFSGGALWRDVVRITSKFVS